LLFEQEDEDQIGQTSKRGLQAIMHGAVHFGTKPSDRTKIILHLSQAVDLQSRENYTQAAEELERAIDVGLDNAAVSFDLGYLMAHEGRLQSAIRHLQRAVKHSQYALGARLLLGQTFQKMGRMKEAVTEFLEALKVADSQVVPAEQAEMLKQLYDPVIEGQIDQPPEVQAGLCKNVLDLLMRPDWHEKITQARQQMPAQPGGGPPIPLADMLTQAKGGRLIESISQIHQLAQAGHLRAAMEEAYYTLQIAPTYLPLHTYIGELLLQQNRVEAAVDKFLVVAQSYSVRGDAHRATEMYRRIVDYIPMDMSIRTRLIEQLTALGQAEDAIGEYLKLADVFYNQADLYNARQTFAQAMKLAHQANVDKAWKVKVLHRMADIDMQSLDWRQAMRDFEQIRNLQPEDEKARISLIDLNFRLGQSTQALAELDNFASYLWKNDRKDQAIQFMENIVAENPKQPAIHRRLAELYRQTGRDSDALKQLDSAGELLMDAGDQTGALECVKAILALNPPNAAEYKNLLEKLS
jgi:tetratricopeptide (TPR) repeat protein